MQKKCEILISQANDALTVSLTQWKKDYTTAQICLQQAADGYRHLKQYDKAIQVYEKLAFVMNKVNDNWGEAKTYDNIIQCLLERDSDNINIQNVINYVEKCIELFVFENSIITIFKTLENIAKLVKQTQIKKLKNFRNDINL